MIVRNEEAILRLTLPCLPTGLPRLALDTGSTDDTVALLQAHGFTITPWTWVNDFSAARNALLQVARTQGLDWLLMLDADEAMFDADVRQLATLCSQTPHAVIHLSRINLAAYATLQACFNEWPDWQARCLRLASTAAYQGRVHEGVVNPAEQALHLPIYHYGWCKSPLENWTRSQNYTLIREGKATDTLETPDWIRQQTEAEWIAGIQPVCRPFTAPHPIAPRFTYDWISHHWVKWEQLIPVKEHARILEIGCFEGLSTGWFMTRFPHCHVTCMDTFEGGLDHQQAGLDFSGVEARFRFNTARWQSQITLLRGRSDQLLSDLPPDVFDMAMIDGSHLAADVRRDIELTWPRIAQGGVVIFDDYEWGPERPVEETPRPTIDAFLTSHAGEYDLLEKGYQVIVRKCVNRGTNNV